MEGDEPMSLDSSGRGQGSGFSLQAVGNPGAVLGTEALRSGRVSESKLLHKAGAAWFWAPPSWCRGITSACLIERRATHCRLSPRLPSVQRGG